MRASSVEGAHVANREGSRGPSSYVQSSTSSEKWLFMCWYLQILLLVHLQSMQRILVALLQAGRQLKGALGHHEKLAAEQGNLNCPGVSGRNSNRSSEKLPAAVALGLSIISWNLLLASSILHRSKSSRHAAILRKSFSGRECMFGTLLFSFISFYVQRKRAQMACRMESFLNSLVSVWIQM